MEKIASKLAIRRILYYYWQHARPHRWLFFGTLGAYAIAPLLMNTSIPVVMRRFIDHIVAAQGSYDTALLWHLLWMIAALMLSGNILFRAGDFTIALFEARMIRDAMSFCLAHIEQHSYAFFADNFAGSLIAKAKRYVGNMERLTDTFVFSFWMTTIETAASIAVLLWIDWHIAVFLVAWVAVYVAMSVVFVRIGIPYDRAKATADSAVTGAFSDSISNILTIKTFAARERELRRFADVVEGEYQARRRAWFFQNIQFASQSAMWMIMQVGGLAVMIWLLLRGQISAGTVVLTQTYFMMISGDLWNLGRALKHFMTGLADAQEMTDIFDTPITVADPATPETSRIGTGAICFDRVSFAYGGADDGSVFQDFSLAIPAGQKVGLVGTSGAGKTTITKLLLRFADVTDGAITIDGQDIRAIRQNDLRAQIAYVPQEPLLFHRSLRDNIAYGQPDADDAVVARAAAMAHAADFIAALPLGYATLVGERGVKLSGGERQRVAIARAILKDAPIVVLDEATSALDSESERHIQEAMTEMMRGRTAIVIAHRLSTLRSMDRIIVLEQGRIVEDGTHDGLVARGGRYAALWRQQAGGFLGE